MTRTARTRKLSTVQATPTPEAAPAAAPEAASAPDQDAPIVMTEVDTQRLSFLMAREQLQRQELNRAAESVQATRAQSMEIVKRYGLHEYPAAIQVASEPEDPFPVGTVYDGERRTPITLKMVRAAKAGAAAAVPAPAPASNRQQRRASARQR